MVLLTITPAMLETLQLLRTAKIPPAELEQKPGEPSLVDAALGGPITHGQAISLAEKCRATQTLAQDEGPASKSPSLETLLRGSRIYIEPPKAKAEPSSEYLALMARLRRDEESRAYEQMTNPLLQKESFAQRFPSSPHAHLFPTSKADAGDDDEETTLSDINRQLAVIFNVIVSIVACSAAIWIVARHWSVPARLGISMGGSGVVGAAEVIVYAGYLRRVKEAKLREKKAVEVKEIVDTWVIRGASSPSEKSDAVLLGQDVLDASGGLRKRQTGSKIS